MAEKSGVQLVTLKDFPHRVEVPTSYFVDKSHWPTVVGVLKNPIHLCCGSKGRPINSILRLFSILAAISALAISLVKDFMEKDDSLQLSTVELVCALIAVSATLVKHCLEWRHVRKQVRKFESASLEGNKKSLKCSKKCPGFFNGSLIAIWFICCSLLLVGFLVFHRLDADTHSLLEYTKFSTAFTVFVSWILDALVTEGLAELTLNWTVDRCALLIHVIKEELYHELRNSGKEYRIDELEKYLRSDKTLDVDRNDRLLAKQRENSADMESIPLSTGNNNGATQLEIVTESANNEVYVVTATIDNPVEKTALENNGSSQLPGNRFDESKL